MHPKITLLTRNLQTFQQFTDHKKNGQQTAGRIVVHDRSRVESEILPRYFNHASFASLRRQLNYFCFSRVGKGKQRGATYCNEQVTELHDILRLKRRTTGSAAQVTHYTKEQKEEEVTQSSIQQPTLQEIVTVQTTPQSKSCPTENIKSRTERKKFRCSRINKKKKKDTEFNCPGSSPREEGSHRGPE